MIVHESQKDVRSVWSQIAPYLTTWIKVCTQTAVTCRCSCVLSLTFVEVL